MKLSVFFKCTVAATAFVPMCGLTAAAETEFTFTPRVWNFTDNSTQLTASQETNLALTRELLENSPLTADGSTIENLTVGLGNNAKSVNINLIGASFSVSNSNLQNWQFTATALYGEDTNTGATAQNVGFDVVSPLGFTQSSLSATNGTASVETKRTDIELTSQRRLESNPQFSLLGGLRYEKQDVRISGDNTITLASVISGFGSISMDRAVASTELTIDKVSLRAGAAAYVPVTDQQRAYLSVQGFAAREAADVGVTRTSFPDSGAPDTVVQATSDNTTWSIGPDISVGYIFALSDSTALDIRYRGMFSFPVDDDLGIAQFDDPRSQHGINIGLSIGF